MKFSDGWIIIYYAIALISKKLNFGINTYNLLYSNYILRYYERGKGEGGGELYFIENLFIWKNFNH